MSIETLDDILDDLAGQMAIYGACDVPGDVGCGRCRVCWMAATRQRLVDAAMVEVALALGRNAMLTALEQKP